MPIYRYEGFKRQEKVTGFLSVESRKEVMHSLREQRIRLARLHEFPEIRETDTEDLLVRPHWEVVACRFLVGPALVERTFRQIASLLGAGVPIVKALRLVARLAPYLMRRSLSVVANRLSGGGHLHEILKQEMLFLDRVTLNLIAVGEANGRLQDMFSYAAELMQQGRQLRGNLLQAFSYPALVIVVTSGAVWFLMEKVIPKVIGFLSARNVQMPALTQALVDTVHFLERWGGWLAASPFILMAVIWFSRQSEPVARLEDRALLHVPFLGKLLGSAENVMWCRTLSILMASGIRVLQSLRLTGETLGNRYLQQQFQWVEMLVQQGHALSLGIRLTAISRVCPLAESMVKIGEDAGIIDQNLREIASFYKEDLDRRVALMGKMIEPALFVIVGAIVAFVYIGFFLGILALSRRGG